MRGPVLLEVVELWYLASFEDSSQPVALIVVNGLRLVFQAILHDCNGRLYVLLHLVSAPLLRDD